MSSGDPRVEAVTEALETHYASGYYCRCGEEVNSVAGHMAAAAVAALDAYDGPKFNSVVHECCERPTEADLRERIAREIEACLPTPCRDLGRGCACSLCYETHAYRDAARIARGQA